MGEEDPTLTEDERDLVRLAAAYGFDLHRPGEKYADDPAVTKGLLVDHYRKLKTKLAEAERQLAADVYTPGIEDDAREG